MSNNQEQKMELKSNTTYTNKEILKWFGLKSKGFKSPQQRQKKMQQLKLFADYQLVGNGKIKKIFIKEVYEPYYTKKGSESFQIIDSQLKNYWRGKGTELDTCKRVGEMMYLQHLTPLSAKSTINYVNKSKVSRFGINNLSYGKQGRSTYAWGKYDETGYVVPLTEEQNQLKNHLIKKYFGNMTQKQIFVQGMIDAGEIREEQAWGVLNELTHMKDKYDAFKAEFQEKINCKLGTGTILIEEQMPEIYLEDRPSAFELEGEVKNDQ